MAQDLENVKKEQESDPVRIPVEFAIDNNILSTIYATEDDLAKYMKKLKETGIKDEKVLREAAIKQFSKAQENAYKDLSDVEKYYRQKEAQEKLANVAKDLAAQKEAIQSLSDITEEERIKALNKIQEAENTNTKAQLQAENEIQRLKLNNSKLAHQIELDNIEKEKKAKEEAAEKERAAIRKKREETVKARQEEIDALEKRRKEEKSLSKEEQEKLSKLRNEQRKDKKEEAKDKAKDFYKEKEENASDKLDVGGVVFKSDAMKKFNGNLDKIFKDGAAHLQKAITAGFDSIDKGIEKSAELLASAQTRLSESGNDYQELVDNIQESVGLSPILKQETLLTKLNEAIDQGIMYNLEERAFLSVISDKIADTFDAFDSNILRLIRLQQADTTATRLGMESLLTEFLNSNYKDSSYMNKGGIADSVTSALIDASAVMTRDQSIEFEFAIQKWLGSLASLGLSDSAATSIASGLNMLATGDVKGLESNSALNTLLAMAAARGGVEYSKMLLNGMDAEATNELLKSMVQYLKEIASTENMVVRQQYAQMYGLSLSDFRAISNLTTADIDNISGTVGNYKTINEHLNSKASTVTSRISLAEQMDNVIDNFTFQIGSQIGTSPVLYPTYYINKMIKDATGGINIPFINAMGFGLDMNTTLNDLINLGIVGAGLLTSIPDIISSFGSAFNGASMLESFQDNSEEFLSRGQGFKGVLGGAFTGISQSMKAQIRANASAEDMQRKTLVDESERTDEIVETTGSEANKHQDDRTSEDLYQMLFESRDVPIKVQMAQSYDDRMVVRVEDYSEDALAKLKAAVIKDILSELKFEGKDKLQVNMVDFFNKFIENGGVDITFAPGEKTNTLHGSAIPVVITGINGTNYTVY